ncbi:MAG: lipase maturation factor family protein [Chthoniobacterales bacterium]
MPRLPDHVAPPRKPLLVYDGDCGFCKLWIARWRERTGDRIDYAPFQQVAENYPEVPREEFGRAVKFIASDGRVSSGAAAVFRSLGSGRRFSLGEWSYEHLPGSAALSEFLYAFVATHRDFAGRMTWLLWGNDVRRPTYFAARRWFLRALGVIYLIAFVSFWAQADGLVGAHGILPLPQFLAAAHTQVGDTAYGYLPTLCWFNSSNAFLHFLCGAGAVISALLVVGFAPILCLALLFILYLSLTIAGQTFFSFQWDILLLETGFLAIFLAPWRWRMRPNDPAPLNPVALFLLQFLLFKLMFMSGVVKLTSGDPLWWNLSALDYHYWTQPLPTVLGWWADKSPEGVKHFSVAATLVIEVVLPFFIWLPRRLRLFAAGAIVLLQVVIGLTGNYAFFNLLTIALCFLLIDDYVWNAKRLTSPSTGARWPVWVPALVLVGTLPINAMLLYSGCRPEATWPRPLTFLYGKLAPFRIVNGYGLFRVMTKERPEIIIEGSNDGADWQPYLFKWKAGPLDRMPGFVEPHQPRLDWQMWFAALSDARQNPWFVRLIVQLLHGEPAVVQLLEKNPFPDKPPRYLRADIYQYHFATAAEHRATGAWWTRGYPQTYLPSVSLGE